MFREYQLLRIKIEREKNDCLFDFQTKLDSERK